MKAIILEFLPARTDANSSGPEYDTFRISLDNDNDVCQLVDLSVPFASFLENYSPPTDPILAAVVADIVACDPSKPDEVQALLGREHTYDEDEFTYEGNAA